MAFSTPLTTHLCMFCLQTLIPVVMDWLNLGSWDFFGGGVTRLLVRNVWVGLAGIGLLRDCGDRPLFLPPNQGQD